MKRRTDHKLLPIVLFALFLFINSSGFSSRELNASNQKQFHFAAYESQFEVHTNANIAVSETLTYQFEGGEFLSAYRYINLYKLDSIEDVQVFGSDGLPYTRINPTDNIMPPRQFFVDYGLNNVVIKWFYDVDARIASVRREFTLSYVMTKAVQLENDMDVLDVDAVPIDTPQVDQVKVTAILPGQFSIDQLTIASPIQGDLIQHTIEGEKTILQFHYETLLSNQAYRVVVGFPQTVQDYFSPRRVINNNAWRIGILWVLGAIIFTIYLYMIRGRDPKVTIPTEYSIELSPRPPQDLLPGEGSSLLNEGKNPALATLATFADLTRQGFVCLEAGEFEDTNPKVIVTELGKEVLGPSLTKLLPVEEDLLRELYELEQESSEPLTLETLRIKKEFMKAFGNKIMDRTVAAGYYEDDPRIVRKSVAKKVGIYSIGTTIGAILMVILFRAWGGFVLLGASFLTAICFSILIFSLPRKTERGVAKEKEYELFLSEIAKRAELAKDRDKPSEISHLIEQFFPWLLIASIPTSFNLYNWLKAIETMPKAQIYPFRCSWYTYPGVPGSVKTSISGGQSTSVSRSLSSFAQSFSASLGSMAASLGASSAGGGFGGGAGAGSGGGAGGGGAGAS